MCDNCTIGNEAQRYRMSVSAPPTTCYGPLRDRATTDELKGAICNWVRYRWWRSYCASGNETTPIYFRGDGAVATAVVWHHDNIVSCHASNDAIPNLCSVRLTIRDNLEVMPMSRH